MKQKEFAFEIGETVLNLLDEFQGIVESRAFYGFENRYTVRNKDKLQLIGEWKLKSIRKVAPQVITATIENDTAKITIQQKDNKQNDSTTEKNTIRGRTSLTPKDQPVAVFTKEHEEQSNNNSFLNESRDKSRNKEEGGKSLYNSANPLEIEEKRSQVKKFFQLTDSLDKILKKDSGFEEAEVTKEIMQKEEEEKFLKEKDKETHLITLNPDSLVRTNDHLTVDSPATPNLQEEIYITAEACPTLEEILPRDEFNQLLYYFKENNILTTMNLVDFELETLFYIPGIPEDLLTQAIKIIRPYKNYSLEIIQKPNTKITDTEDVIGQKEETILQESSECNTLIEMAETPKEELIFDIPIADFYQEIPNSLPFIEYCKQIGKTLMSEISRNDFYTSKDMIKFSNTMMENLFDAWTNFLNIRDIEFNRNMYFMHKTFKDAIRGNLFIQRCNEQNIFSLSDLLKHDFSSLELPNIGKKAIKDIHKAFLKSLNDPFIVSYLSPLLLGKIPEENQFIPIKSLYDIGLNSECIKSFHAKGIFYVKDLAQNNISHWEYAYAKKTLDILQVPISQLITSYFANLDERDRLMVEEKICGKTLEQIGELNDITRERVRQIIKKVIVKSRPIIYIFNQVMVKKYNGVYSTDDIDTFFGNEIIAKMVAFALTELNLVVFMEFSHIFLDKSLINIDIQKTLNQMAIDIIGEGVDYSKQTEAIESELSEHSLEFLSNNDFTNYLISSGYHFYGDFVTRGKGSYALICVDAIKKYFEFDIKLDQDENNEDMLKLREIVRAKYPGITLPEGNRALLSRVSFFLVLSGRGRYCPIEKIVYSPEIFEEVFDFIETSDLTTFYYSELFSQYQGRFLAETNIDNSHFLHGVLKYLYPKAYVYERDLLRKKGEERQDVNFRINDMLANTSGPITRKKIEKNFPGINSWVISMTIDRLPDVIQWEYNEFMHISNIGITTEEIDTIDQIISTHMNAHSGYASEGMLFNSIKKELPQFIKRNNIKSSQNIFYLSARYLEEKYRFSRPHIVSLDFPEIDLTIVKIAKVLLKEPVKLNYQELIDFTENVLWNKGSVNHLVGKIFNGYMRISENDYIKRSVFSLSDSERNALSNHLSDIIPPSGYIAIESIFDYSLFPNLEIENELELEWNGFLLESLIETLKLDFVIVTPQAKDRRYQRGIIVKPELSVISFEDLIVKLLRIENRQQLTEEDLISFLKIKGLSNSSYLPQELFDCQNLVYSNRVFQLKNQKQLL